MKIRLIITVTLLILIGIFLIQNAATVDIRFLFWNLAMPRSLLIFMTLIIGVVIGWFMRAMYRLTRTKQGQS